MRTALSIAGSDPTGGAGIQADLQVFRALGVHGAAVVTALTVQDTEKVHQSLPAFPNVVLDQLRVLLRDVTPHAVKVGMLATDDIARNVALALASLDDAVPVVLDPVLAASDGTPLLERRAWHTLQGLFPRCTLVTPNLREAELLSGNDTATRTGCESAARTIVEELGAGAILLKGGHREGAPDDLFVWRDADRTGLEWLPGTRIDVGEVHGTGCALSAAIAAALARDVALREAVERGRQFVAGGLERAHQAGRVARLLGFG